MCRDVLAELVKRRGENVTKTLVRENVALAEAPSNGQSIFTCAPKSYGAEDYTQLAAELQHRMEGRNG